MCTNILVFRMYVKTIYKLLLSVFIFRLCTFRRALDAEMRQSSEDGVMNKTKKPEREGLTEQKERILWEKNLLGSNSQVSNVVK